jgi:hypothetical protein
MLGGLCYLRLLLCPCYLCIETEKGNRKEKVQASIHAFVGGDVKLRHQLPEPEEKGERV